MVRWISALPSALMVIVRCFLFDSIKDKKIYIYIIQLKHLVTSENVFDVALLEFISKNNPRRRLTVEKSVSTHAADRMLHVL